MRAHGETTPSECAICPAGLFAASPEASECSVCPIGTFATRIRGAKPGKYCLFPYPRLCPVQFDEAYRMVYMYACLLECFCPFVDM